MLAWVVGMMLLPALVSPLHAESTPPQVRALLDRIGTTGGVCVFVGLPQSGGPERIVQLAQHSSLQVYVQVASQKQANNLREAAEKAGLLGRQIWVDTGRWETIQMANNLADAVLVGPDARGKTGTPRREILRVLHPRAKGFLGQETIAKPVPQGLDSWSHPYHGPDNNPQSADQLARSPYLTQFLGEPMFGCISEVSVASGGRVFKAFGHIAFKEISNEVLNTLYAINAYNGTILWKRKLTEGFMIHRNTIIATPENLYLADDKSCKVIDAKTGEIQREIRPPADKVGGTVWKWMALQDGVLYAMIGGQEVGAQVRRGDKKGYGGWPWGMWKGYDYRDPAKAFGFGRHFVALDVASGKILWTHQEQEYFDGRAVCMKGDRLYAYAPESFLICLNTNTGKPVWKSTDKAILEAIGPNGRAQGYIRGFATSAYLKCNDSHLFFAGPQRSRLVAVSLQSKQPELGWTFGDGNFQLVLRDEALYAFGGQKRSSYKLDFQTGKVLEQFSGRRACTRATGSLDSIFCRARGGTLRLNLQSQKLEHIAPMRPACHDGVLISEGHLYWGPWICACQLSLFGHIGLGPAGDFDFNAQPRLQERIEYGPGDWKKVTPADPQQSALTLTAGDDGVVRARRDDKLLWRAYTGGGINFSPVLWENRVFAGSNDGRVYAWEAATGRLLWRFQVAPAVRRIPVYGELMSTWPAAGGVAVQDGVVYTAAGIAHYDGTHVYALDARSGTIKWHNGSSGSLNPTLKNGISLAGQVRIGPSRLGEKVLQFPGGNAVRDVAFDLKTGKCLTPPPTTPTGVARSTFYVDRWSKSRSTKSGAGKTKP